MSGRRGCRAQPRRCFSKQISIPSGVVEASSRLAVVAVVGEDPSLGVKIVGPVDLRTAGIQHDESDGFLDRGALVPEAALVSYG